ncbi:MAG: chromate transporter [Bacilli bacterium]
MRKIRALWDLFITFFKIGLFTFGGGYAMIPLIEEEVVHKKRFLHHREALDLFIIAESTPGPVSVNAATYVGYKVARLPGALFATLGLALPSLIIIILIAIFYDQFIALKWVKAAFRGIQVGVSILIISAGIKLCRQLERNVYNIASILMIIGLQVLFSLLEWRISSIYFIIIGFVLGLVLFGLMNIEKRGRIK